jgi:hypothetical protein
MRSGIKEPPNGELVLRSPLPPEVCVARIKQLICTDWASWADGPEALKHQPFTGSISFRRFRLAKRLTYQNSFNPVFIGTLTPDGKGTVIRGTVGLDPGGAVMLMLLALGAGVGAVALLVFAVRQFLEGHQVAGFQLAAAAFLPGVFAFAGVAMARVRYSPETGEAVFILDCLSQHLEADASAGVGMARWRIQQCGGNRTEKLITVSQSLAFSDACLVGGDPRLPTPCFHPAQLTPLRRCLWQRATVSPCVLAGMPGFTG